MCGSVRVRWDHRRPALGFTHIAFKLYRHTDHSRPALGTLVALDGGPGGASTRNAAFPVYYAFTSVLRRRDLLLVDQRGTGDSEAIDCPALQQTPAQVLPTRGGRAAVRACARRLGRHANLYGSAVAAEDLDAVRAALGIRRIDLYGVSYGTFLAQAYAVRHPGRLRSLILDSAYPARGMDPWERDNARALRLGLERVCRRDAACRAAHRDPVADVARAAARLRRRPVLGRVKGADGLVRLVRIGAPELAGLGYDAGGFTPPKLYENLAAVSRALLAGNPQPLLQLYADNLAEPDPARNESNGLYAAVTCHDYPLPFDRFAPVRTRRAELARARARLPRDAFAPFSVADWLSAPIEPANYTTCTEWPSPPRSDPPIPPGARFPRVPTLILAGDLDTSTALGTARTLARSFPHVRFVTFRNRGHVLLATPCGQQLVARFVARLDPGHTRCAARQPPLRPAQAAAP